MALNTSTRVVREAHWSRWIAQLNYIVLAFAPWPIILVAWGDGVLPGVVVSALAGPVGVLTFWLLLRTRLASSMAIIEADQTVELATGGGRLNSFASSALEASSMRMPFGSVRWIVFKGARAVLAPRVRWIVFLTTDPALVLALQKVGVRVRVRSAASAP